MMKYCLLISFSFLLLSVPLSGQNAKLADQYYLEAEYQKAADLYLKLHEKSKKNKNYIYFNKYIECLLALKEFEQAEKDIRNQMSEQPNDYNLLVTLGNVQERIGNYEEAEKSYRKAIDKLPARIDAITRLGNAFLGQAKYSEAIETYEKGEELLEKPGIFSYQLANLYQRNGDIPKMIEQYLYSLHSNPARIENVKNMLQRSLSPDDYTELLSQTYVFIQDYPETDYFPELLAWVFIQQKDYSRAMRQAKTLDKRLEENGLRVYRLAQVAANDKDYDTAIDGYEYILESQHPGTPYYLEAKRSSLATKRKKITENFNYTTDQLRILEAEYLTFIDSNGINPSTALIVSELAKLEAVFINDLPKAISLLEQLIAVQGINKHVKAGAKLDLGDYYLMSGEVWEATLLYSQVDKDFVEDLIGQDARFRNAKLSYFNGDFEWAQTQFDILKTSTSKLIANDALDLSVFIMDNLGLDSNAHAMTAFAEAELLIFQNKLDEAIEALTILGNVYSEHNLKDDILYLKARLFEKKRDYLAAEVLYQEIIDNFPEEIRADNALYNQAKLYENQLGSPEKAMVCYERIFLEYTDSTFAIESRKRFRELRGDYDTEDQMMQ